MKPVTHASETHRQNGFTLVEIAIVLAIIGFLTAGILGGLGAFRDSADFKQDERQLKDIKEALLSFVAVNGYLPCPDTDDNGRENRQGDPDDPTDPDQTDGSCSETHGSLPFSDLGTHSKNPWGKPYYYLINTDATQSAETVNPDSSASYFGSVNCDDSETENGAESPCFNIETPPKAGGTASGNYDVKVMNSDADNLVSDTPLVVLSLGSNGCPGVADEEKNNCDAEDGTSQTLYKGQQSRQDNDFFDDALIWLTALEIKRFTSGVLPDGSGDPTDPNPPNGYPPGGQPPDSSDSDYDFDQTVNGDMDNSNDVNTTNQEDSILIEGDLNQSIDLKNGDDVLYITGDANSSISLGNQDKEIIVEGNLHNSISGGSNGNSPNDTANGDNLIHIMGNQTSSITLGNGDNRIYIEGDSQNSIDLGNGENVVSIGGNATSSINVGSDDGNIIYIGGTLQNSITGSGTVYLENLTDNQVERIGNGFTILQKNNDGDWEEY